MGGHAQSPAQIGHGPSPVRGADPARDGVSPFSPRAESIQSPGWVSPCSAAVGAPGGGELPQQRGAERGQRGYSEYSQGYYRTGWRRAAAAARCGARAAPRSRTTQPSTSSTCRISRRMHPPTHARTRLRTHGSEGPGRAGTHVATIGSVVFQRYAWTTWNLLIDTPDIDVARREMRSH